MPRHEQPGLFAIFVPAWDEATVIASMLKATLRRLDYPNYRIFVGYYGNDPATASAITSVEDSRIERVRIEDDGPTTKAHCLNHLYDALIAFETASGASAKAIVLHDAEDVVHPLELLLFDELIGRAALVQLPVLPLVDPSSRWIGGHYCDEFAEAHSKELVVREAVGASIPLAGVGCAIAREALARIAAINEGRPFAGTSMTEDYELGLRIGAMGLKTMFVRIGAMPGDRAVVATRGHFPATLGAAIRQKSRWLGGIALSGWDRLGWSGGIGERWMRMRDRRGPLAAILLVAAYGAALLWSQIWLAEALGATIDAELDPSLITLLQVNGWLLAWRILMRAAFTTSAYGWRQGLLSVPRLVVGNVIAMLAAARAVHQHLGGGPRRWDKTSHIFPAEFAH
jgi:adsorption protein B